MADLTTVLLSDPYDAMTHEQALAALLVTSDKPVAKVSVPVNDIANVLSFEELNGWAAIDTVPIAEGAWKLFVALLPFGVFKGDRVLQVSSGLEAQSVIGASKKAELDALTVQPGWAQWQELGIAKEPTLELVTEVLK